LLNDRIQALIKTPEIIQALTGFSWIISTLNATVRLISYQSSNPWKNFHHKKNAGNAKIPTSGKRRSKRSKGWKTQRSKDRLLHPFASIPGGYSDPSIADRYLMLLSLNLLQCVQQGGGCGVCGPMLMTALWIFSKQWKNKNLRILKFIG
jgi:hypothetical protein